MSFEFFYSLPNSILLFIFVVVLVSISLIGLYIFTILVSKGFVCTFDDVNTGVYLATIAVALGVLIAFIISDEWQRYNTADINMTQEANSLFLLLTTLTTLPGTNETKILTVQYICSIINVEFPAMQLGQVPSDNNALDALLTAVYDYVPSDPRQQILYEKTLDLVNQATALREQRLEVSMKGIAPEIWWIFIFGFIIIMVLTWFIKGVMIYRIVMNALVVATYASLLFLAVALNYPFRGNLALTPQPFIFVLESVGATCA